MGMKRASQRRAGRSSGRAAAAKQRSGKPADLAAIREQIANLVGHEAVGMVETTIEEVGKGHYLGMKYLFEMIGLFPATAAAETPAQDSMAATLLRRLSLPELPNLEPPVSPGLETSGSAADDSLE